MSIRPDFHQPELRDTDVANRRLSLDTASGPSASTHVAKHGLSRDHSQSKTPPPDRPRIHRTDPLTNEPVMDTPEKCSSHGGESEYSNVDALQDVLAQELRDTWVDGDSAFIEEFVNEQRIDDVLADGILAQCKDYRDGRWTTLQNVTKEDRGLYTALVKIINDIIAHSGGNALSRRAVISDRTRMSHTPVDDRHSNLTTSPDISLLGYGPSVSRAQSLPEKAEYVHCLVPIEVKTEESRRPMHRDQLAVYTRECFSQSHNRRFTYGLILTEKKVQMFKFDRSGCMYSQRIDIHERAHDFVRIISGLASDDEARLGYDTGIFWDEQRQTRVIHMKDHSGDEVTYDIDGFRPFFYRRAIRGRGTVCWRVRDGETSLLVKDSWRSEGRTPEYQFLERAKGLPGVGQMVTYEDNLTTISGSRWNLPMRSADAIADNGNPRRIVDRILCRIVLQCYGDPIDKFKTRFQLLSAFRDAVAGHQNLFNIEILHRDVSLRNILLGCSNVEVGNRGLLIDMDLAIDLLLGKSQAASDFRTGTRAFQSVMVLQSESKKVPHDYLDDLESFFYVLCWVCFGHSHAGRRIPNEKRPIFFEEWEEMHPLKAASRKRDFLLAGDGLEARVSPWFGDIFDDLILQLHQFCSTRLAAKLAPFRRRLPGAAVIAPLIHDPDKDYAEFLGYIDAALQALEGIPDDPIPPQPPVKAPRRSRRSGTSPRTSGQSSEGASSGSSGSRKRGSGNEDDDNDYIPGGTRNKKARYGRSHSSPSASTLDVVDEVDENPA